MIKYLRKEYRRRRILRDIKKAKELYEMKMANYMCASFILVRKKYFRQPIDSIIPEFNQDFLNAKYKQDYIYPWWDISDRESRIKAFDKLIEVYSKKKDNNRNGESKS